VKPASNCTAAINRKREKTTAFEVRLGMRVARESAWALPDDGVVQGREEEKACPFAGV